MPFRPAPFLWVALLFAGLCLPLVWSDRTTNYTSDEDLYHLPAVRQIRAHWPALDLRRDSLSATAPGYHYLLATLSLVTGSERRPLRLATFAVSLALLGLLWGLFPREHAVLGAAAVLPLAASNFFVKSASWIVTDNPALLAMTATLALILLAPRPCTTAWAGGMAAVTVFVRQMYAWLVAPILLRVWFDCRGGRDGARWTWALAALPPLGIVGLLAIAWGGLVPPGWRDVVHDPAGTNPAAPLAYGLAVLGLLGGFYYFVMAQANWRRDFGRWSTRIGAGLGLALTLAGPTYSFDAGRSMGRISLESGRTSANTSRPFDRLSRARAARRRNRRHVVRAIAGGERPDHGVAVARLVCDVAAVVRAQSAGIPPLFRTGYFGFSRLLAAADPARAAGSGCRVARAAGRARHRTSHDHTPHRALPRLLRLIR
jgi:hypothetical protein